MYKDKYELNVLVSEKPIREYYHRDRFLVEARRGAEYSLRLKNHSAKKILAVFSVDGLDVLKGKSASEAEGGYIINPFSTLSVKGYRLDDNSVAAFKFEDGGKSYASLTENDNNVERAAQNPSRNNGVIGVRIWEEKETNWVPAWKSEPNVSHFYNYPDPTMGIGTGSFALGSGMSYNPMNVCSGYSSSLSSNSARVMAFGVSPSLIRGLDQTLINSSSVPNFTVGTAWGNQIEDKVIKASFQKSESMIEMEMFYLDRQELINYGVDIENAKKIFMSGFPSAFGTKDEYCHIPANWGGTK